MLQKLHEVDAETVKQWVDNGDAILIDVREVEEYNLEYIPKAQLFPLSSFSPQQIPKGDGKKIVFHCKAGRRSANAATKWADFSGAPDAYSLKGGIDAWKSSGLATLSNQATSKNIQSQAYFWAGILVLAGTFLAAAISSWFLLLTALGGVLLVSAGIFGLSFLSYILAAIKSKKPDSSK